MALQTADPPVAPSAQVVANAFVEQYYHILHHSPELVYRFYHDSSVLSRQDENGEMISVTTMQGINAKILSSDYKNFKAEIKTADAQESHKDGVIVLVTGCLTGKDNLRKKFAQSFFLAPQSKGYFVLNDVFRYIDESEPLHTNTITIEKVDDSGAVQTPISAELPRAPEAHTSDVATSDNNNEISVENVTHALEKERQVANEEIPASSQSENLNSSVVESSLMPGQEDGVKNSYASIVKKVKGNPRPTKVYVPANTVKSAPTNSQKQSSGLGSGALDSDARQPAEKNKEAPEDVNAEEGYSIYVRNLPMNVMDAEVDQEFKRFGPIKPGGVQVRSNKQQGYCYGFVEFLSASSVESAIKASPITIAGRQAFVEIKRTTSRVDAGRARYPSARGSFRSDSFRGRGGYGGGRGFSGNEYGSRGEYSSRGRGRGGEGYPRGRGGRGTNQNIVAR